MSAAGNVDGGNKAYGVYFIFKSLEVGPTFRITVPKYPAQDPNYRIVALQRSRFTHYYFYIRDEMLGPIVMCVGSFFPLKTTYYSTATASLNSSSIARGRLSQGRQRVSGGERRCGAQAITDELSPKSSANDSTTGPFCSVPNSLPGSAGSSGYRVSTRSVRSSTASILSSSATFPSTNSSSAAVSSACGD